jgi:predicted kinase
MSAPPREGTQLVFLGGLPGSGKTTYAKRLEEKGWVFYDDFQARAAGDSPRFRASRHYAELVSHIRAGRRCIVSDIRVIHEEYRRDAAAALRQDVGNVPTELHLFENNPDQCGENVRNAKDGRRVEPRLQAIAFWSKHYSAPNHAVLHRVWRPAKSQDLLEP